MTHRIFRGIAIGLLGITALLAQTELAQTEKSLNDGRLALERGQPLEAADNYKRALADLKARGRPVEEVLPVQLSLVTAYLEAREFHHAEALLQDAQRRESTIPKGRLAAEFHNARGSLFLLLGKLGDAEFEFERAKQNLELAPEKTNLRADVSHNLAAIETRTGRFADAYRDEELALHLWEANGETQTDRFIRGLGSLASLQFLTGREQDARVSMERALAAAEKLYGPRHPLTAALLDSYAIILDKLKYRKEARAARQRAAAARAHLPKEPAETTIDARQPGLGEVSLRAK
jgi:tetratricopeptide (TPR) repeat protein